MAMLEKIRKTNDAFLMFQLADSLRGCFSSSWDEFNPFGVSLAAVLYLFGFSKHCLEDVLLLGVAVLGATVAIGHL